MTGLLLSNEHSQKMEVTKTPIIRFSRQYMKHTSRPKIYLFYFSALFFRFFTKIVDSTSLLLMKISIPLLCTFLFFCFLPSSCVYHLMKRSHVQVSNLGKKQNKYINDSITCITLVLKNYRRCLECITSVTTRISARRNTLHIP